jgi:hypothetical protein
MPNVCRYGGFGGPVDFWGCWLWFEARNTVSLWKDTNFLSWHGASCVACFIYVCFVYPKHLWCYTPWQLQAAMFLVPLLLVEARVSSSTPACTASGHHCHLHCAAFYILRIHSCQQWATVLLQGRTSDPYVFSACRNYNLSFLPLVQCVRAVAVATR